MERRHGKGRCEPGCFGCKILEIDFSPRCFGTRTPSAAPPAKPRNSWEKGIVTDGRGLPVTGADGKPIGVAQAANNRKAIDAQIRAVKDPQFHRKTAAA
jgi:hypothetical protein